MNKVKFSEVKEGERFVYLADNRSYVKKDGLATIALHRDNWCQVDRTKSWKDIKPGRCFKAIGPCSNGNIWMRTNETAIVVQPAHPIDAGFVADEEHCNRFLSEVEEVNLVMKIFRENNND